MAKEAISRLNRKRHIVDAGYMWNLVFFLTLIVYAVGLLVPIMEIDAAVYAEVSMEMALRNNFLEILKQGADWLDKPPFPFWITALFYKLFGVHEVVYKLPAIVFTLVAILYTYLFGKKFYSPLKGYIAAFLLFTAQHVFISNNDVRAEPFMMGLTIFSLFFIAGYIKEKRFYQLVFGSLGLACLVMTKGLFTIIPVAAGVFFSLLYKRNWKEIFHPGWLLVALLMILFMFPALYGYYVQFDLHPEKEIFGQHGVSGVKFFLWTSQWGRFSNTGPIVGKGDPFFFVHTMLWAYAPWALLGFFALFHRTRDLLRKKPVEEWYTYFGFIVMFIIFSASRFQLSYYLNAIFPLLSLIVADVLMKQAKNIKFLKLFSTLQWIQCLGLLLTLLVLQYFFFGGVPGLDTLFFTGAGLLAALYLFAYKKHYLKKILFGSALVVVSINYYLNRQFYPALLKYQSETEVVNFMAQQSLDSSRLVTLDADEIITDMLLQRLVPHYTIEEAGSPDLSGKLVFTTENGLIALQAAGKEFKELKRFDDFRITVLTGAFLNRKTRPETLDKRFLVEIEGPE